MKQSVKWVRRTGPLPPYPQSSYPTLVGFIGNRKENQTLISNPIQLSVKDQEIMLSAIFQIFCYPSRMLRGTQGRAWSNLETKNRFKSTLFLAFCESFECKPDWRLTARSSFGPASLIRRMGVSQTWRIHPELSNENWRTTKMRHCLNVASWEVFCCLWAKCLRKMSWNGYLYQGSGFPPDGQAWSLSRFVGILFFKWLCPKEFLLEDWWLGQPIPPPRLLGDPSGDPSGDPQGTANSSCHLFTFWKKSKHS